MAADAQTGPAEITVEATVYRYANYDTPFWARANSLDGRWHRVGDGPTQFFSLSIEAAWAELIRTEDLRSEADVATVQMPIWQARVSEARIADYGTFEKTEAAGLDPAALVDDDHTSCQLEGLRLRELGLGGVLAPSAALPGDQVLVLFGARRAIEWTAEPRLASAVPASRIGVGAPPGGLVDRVRFRGG
jgi:RES domain-containing protein